MVTRVQNAHSVVPSSSHVSGMTIFASYRRTLMVVPSSRTSNHSAMAPVPMAKARSMPRWNRA